MVTSIKSPAHRFFPRSSVLPFSFFAFFFSAFLSAALLSGCAAPGEPIERRPPVPTAVADLAASQQGSSVVLTFTLPTQTTQNRPLKFPPAVEIYRAFSPSSPPPANLSLALVVTIPPAMLVQFSEHNLVRYPAALAAEDFSQHPGETVVYSVRTRATEKAESADSNLVSLLPAVPPRPIADAKAEVTHDAIVLSWTPPASSLTGSPVNITGFRVYRAELSPAPSPASNAPAVPAPKRKPSLILIGESDPSAPSFSDPRFSFGATYEYSVRTAYSSGSAALESDDSNLVDVTPRDVFPPAAPQDLEAVYVPAQSNSPAALDLSWAINTETDLAGYNIYRSEQQGARGDRLNSQPLRTPSFRDMNALPGRLYFYTVTAVDTSGLESDPSAAVSAALPAASP